MTQSMQLPRTATAQGEVIARQAFEARQSLRTATQGTLTPGGWLVSMAIEKKYTFAGQYDTYGKRLSKIGPYAPVDVYRRIVEASGSSNKWVSGLNQVSKVVAPVGAALGLISSGRAIADAPSGQKMRVTTEKALNS